MALSSCLEIQHIIWRPRWRQTRCCQRNFIQFYARKETFMTDQNDIQTKDIKAVALLANITFELATRKLSQSQPSFTSPKNLKPINCSWMSCFKILLRITFTWRTFQLNLCFEVLETALICWCKLNQLAHTRLNCIDTILLISIVFKGFLHQYHPYTIKNFVQCGKIENKIDRGWGPLQIIEHTYHCNNNPKSPL